MPTPQSGVADLGRGDGAVPDTDNAGKWRPSGHELMVMITLAVVSLMVSLDATVIITSLSVQLNSASNLHCRIRPLTPVP